MRVQADIVNYGKGSLNPSYLVIHEMEMPGASAKDLVKYWQRDDKRRVHCVVD